MALPLHSYSQGKGQTPFTPGAGPPAAPHPLTPQPPGREGGPKLGEPPPEHRPLPARSQAGWGVMCQGLPGGGEPGRRGCHVREGSGQEAGQEQLHCHSAVAGPFLTSQRLNLPPPPQPRGLLPSLPAPCAPSSPRESFQCKSPAGTPGWVKCWKNNLSLWLPRLNS